MRIKEGLNKALLMTLMLLLVYAGTTLNVGYYTKSDLLGPMSKFPIVFVALGIAIALAMAFAFRHKPSRGTAVGHLILALPVFLLVLYLLFLPDAAEKYMLTNHYDVPQHMARAMYLADTGRIDINVDRYFDLQPGVFYSTAIFMIVTGIDAHAIFKWFPLFFVIVVYLPALVFLGTHFFKDKGDLAIFVFLALVITWPPTRYHYSAQVYLMPIFIIVAGFLIKMEGRFNRQQLIFLLLAFAAIVVTHQGVALFTLVMLVSILLFSAVQSRGRSRETRLVLRLILFFLVLWFAYLGWLTVFAFGDLIYALGAVAYLILTESFWSIFAGAVARTDPSYQMLVYGKVIFTAITYLLGLSVLACLWKRKSSSKHGALLSIISFVCATIYVLGFALGGRGFVERAVLMTGPLVAVGLVFLTSRIGRAKSPWPMAMLLILLVLTGTALFNSSRSFQFRLLSEQTCEEFVSFHDPAQIPFYHSVKITVPRYTGDEAMTDIGKAPEGIFMIMPSYLIESSYWVPEAILSDAITARSGNPSEIRFYSNGLSTMYLATSRVGNSTEAHP